MPAPKKPAPAKGETVPLARNRKAFHDYEIVDRLEAGLELRGTEVKSVREGRASLVGAWAHVDKDADEVWLDNATIQPYEYGNLHNHVATRMRRLLLHRREILRLRAFTERKGHTLVPLELYLKRGRVKLLLGVCRGKTEFDKRETIKRRELDRDARRAIANAVRR